MSSAIGRVLGILRLLRPNIGTTAYEHVKIWLGGDSSPAKIAKICSWVIEETDAADSEINALKIDQETKDGLLHINDQLRSAFTITNINNGTQNYFPALPQTIGNLVTFLRLSGLERPHQPELAENLLVEIEEVLNWDGFAALDPRIAEVARRHLRLLTITLNHLDAFGVDAALVAYTELIVRMQRAAQDAAPAEREKAQNVLDRMSGWAKALKTLNEAYEAGTKLLGNLSDAARTLGVG